MAPSGTAATLACCFCFWLSTCVGTVASTSGADVSHEVVSKSRLPAGTSCTDSLGAVVPAGGSWRTNGACDLNKCYYNGVGAYHYVIRQTCREVLVNENPEYGASSSNCNVVSLPALPYPYCCSYLSCAGRAPVSTTPAPACADRSKSCIIYLSNGGCSVTSNIYNWTSTYCRRTCELC